jgi:hypothetical protein
VIILTTFPKERKTKRCAIFKTPPPLPSKPPPKKTIEEAKEEHVMVLSSEISSELMIFINI